MRVSNRFLPALVAIAFVAACTSDSPSDERPPNILVILTDDQPIGLMHAMPKTQRLFEQQGVSFTEAYATTPQCCPSRASILSGRYAHHHGVLNNTRGWAEKLDPETSVAKYLKDEEYETAIFGKYLNLWPEGMDPPYFDSFSILTGGGGHYSGGTWNVQGESRVIDKYSTTYVEENGLRFLKSQRDQDGPWALFLWVSAPHTPTTPEPRYEDAETRPLPRDPSRWETDISDKPAIVTKRQASKAATRDNHRAQQLTLMSVDDMVGQVFDELRSQEAADNTLAFFLSDNGYLFGEHGMRGKSVPYLPAAKIPLMVRYPERLEPSGPNDSLVANLDVAATIMDAATGKIPRTMEGRSLLDVAGGERLREHLLLEHFGIEQKGIPPWASIVTQDFQYNEYYDSSGKRIASEYYDLREDPYQLNNLLAQGATMPSEANVGRLSRRLVTYRFCAGQSCP
ncbi:MAG: sulfatase-like hydrolase/transferase [Actinobacteria bacterium]|nr:sulfatase-like hydrolase/transferase [Actinomycetota bacterium]